VGSFDITFPDREERDERREGKVLAETKKQKRAILKGRGGRMCRKRKKEGGKGPKGHI